MTHSKVLNDYFEWICSLVCDDKSLKRVPYLKLLHYLHDTEFVYIIGMDSNRAEDGIDLRYRFGCEYDYESAMITNYLDAQSCSILEMLIALSIRCEEHIMDDPDIGNRTGKWFWGMISNLGLDEMKDANFDLKYVNNVISKFINRKYERNGKGGLFTVKNTKHDLRTAEIWYQLCWYLDDILKY